MMPLGSEGGGGGEEEGNVPYFLQGLKLDLRFFLCLSLAAFPPVYLPGDTNHKSQRHPFASCCHSVYHIGGSTGAKSTGCHKLITVLIKFELGTYKYANDTSVAM